jgi:hypothetical protein
METIKEIIMRRDGETEVNADERIAAAQEEIEEMFDLEGTTITDLEDIIMDHFCLEPDFLMELLPL